MKTVIQNGIIIDGTGAVPFKGSLAFENGIITKLSTSAIYTKSSDTVIEAYGNYITPGFIDMHTHTDLAPFIKQGSKQKIMQGITTEVTGQCGLGVAPIPGRLQTEYRKQLIIGDAPIGRWPWESYFEYLKAVEWAGLETNMIPYVPHGVVKYAISQNSSTSFSIGELERFTKMLKASFEAGAWGGSFGFIYEPAIYATKEEIETFIQISSLYKTLLSVHVRSESDELLHAVQEMIDYTALTESQLHISHLKSIGSKNWHQLDAVLELLSKNGVSFDCYPYCTGSTTLLSLIPPWILARKESLTYQQSLTELLKKPEIRNYITQIYSGTLHPPKGSNWDNLPLYIGWDHIFIGSVAQEKHQRYRGKTFAELSSTLDRSPADIALDLIMEEPGTAKMYDTFMDETILKKILQHPNGCLSTDTLPGPYQHPRGFGAFARFWSYYTKTLGWFSEEDAIYRMSGKTAAFLGLKDRGTLSQGSYADVLVFSPDFKDIATFKNPHEYAVGIDYVFINGVPKVVKGDYTANKSGKLIRR